jgi:hypothetical protein
MIRNQKNQVIKQIWKIKVLTMFKELGYELKTGGNG